MRATVSSHGKRSETPTNKTIDPKTNSKLISTFLKPEEKQTKDRGPEGATGHAGPSREPSRDPRDPKDSKDRTKAQAAKSGPALRPKPAVTPFR